MQLKASLATLAAAITTVNAVGSAIIQNNCAFPVYMWAVDASRNPGSPSVIASGSSYSEGYRSPGSGGVSLKLSLSKDITYVTQFEYTLQSYNGDSFIWYDGSDVDCTDSECPFWNYGVSLTPSISSCPSRSCPIQETCTGFYTYWNNDINSLSCADSASITMTLCSADAGSSSGGGDSKSSDSETTKSSTTVKVAQKQVETAATPTSASAEAVVTATTTAAPVINEAVVTTFVTEYKYNTKRAVEVPHGHMHFHQRHAGQQ